MKIHIDAEIRWYYTKLFNYYDDLYFILWEIFIISRTVEEQFYVSNMISAES